MEENKYLLINSAVLPPVFRNVVLAKELLNSGKASSAAQAARMAGISRSAFYKYKDFVFNYSDSKDTASLSVTLQDKAGVFSALTTGLYNCGANIITVNQSVPSGGTADVSVTIETGGINISVDKIPDKLLLIDGVIKAKINYGGIK